MIDANYSRSSPTRPSFCRVTQSGATASETPPLATQQPNKNVFLDSEKMGSGGGSVGNFPAVVL